MPPFKFRNRSDFLQPYGLPTPFHQRVTAGIAHGTKNSEEVALKRRAEEKRLFPDMAGVLYLVRAAPLGDLTEEVFAVELADGFKQVDAHLLSLRSDVTP